MKDQGVASNAVTSLHQFEWLADYQEKEPKISVIRCLNNMGAFSYGYVETSENCRDFFRYVNAVNDGGSVVYIYNEDGTCVYPYQGEGERKTAASLLGAN